MGNSSPALFAFEVGLFQTQLLDLLGFPIYVGFPPTGYAI